MGTRSCWTTFRCGQTQIAVQRRDSRSPARNSSRRVGCRRHRGRVCGYGRRLPSVGALTHSVRSARYRARRQPYSVVAVAGCFRCLRCIRCRLAADAAWPAVAPSPPFPDAPVPVPPSPAAAPLDADAARRTVPPLPPKRNGPVVAVALAPGRPPPPGPRIVPPLPPSRPCRPLEMPAVAPRRRRCPRRAVPPAGRVTPRHPCRRWRCRG